MSLNERRDMSDSHVDALLARHETGVLSLAKDNAPHAFPVSYGYDPDERIIYLRLVSGPTSEKRELLTGCPSAQFVVYEHHESTINSVIATGTLERRSLSELKTEDIEAFGHAKRPLFEMWSEPTSDLDIRLYAFEPDVLSGRRIDVDLSE